MTEFVAEAVKKTAIIAAVSLSLALSGFLAWEGYLSGKIAHDFSVYWRTANQPVEMAYQYRWPPFPYAPTMLAWIAPLGFVSKWAGYFIVVAGSITSLVLACRPYLSKAAIALALISPPVFRCLRNGQVSALLAALLIWACGTGNRIAAGVALGVIFSIKPQLVVAAPLMLVLNRDWRAFVAAGATVLALALLSLLFGPERWVEWWLSMPEFHAIVTGTNVINIGITPGAVAERFGLNPVPFIVLGALAGAALVYLCSDRNPLEKATAIGLASIMAAPYALAYDLVVIVPFLASLALRGSLVAGFGMMGMVNPMPLFAGAFVLSAAWMRRSRNRKSAVGGVAGNALGDA